MDEINKLNEDIAKLRRQLGQSPIKLFKENEIEEAKLALAGLRGELREIQNDAVNLAGAFRETVNEIRNQNTSLKDSTKTLRGLQSISQKIKYDQEGIGKLSLKELQTLKKQAEQRKSDLRENLDQLSRRRQELESDLSLNKKSTTELKSIRAAEAAIKNELEGVVDGRKQELGLVDTLNIAIDERIAREKRIQESLGISGGVLKGIEGTMNKIGLGALSQAVGFNDINSQLREYAEELEDSEETLTDQEKQTKVLGKGFELVGEKVKKALSDPFILIAIGMKAMSALANKLSEGFKASQENTGALAKNLNISNDEAMELSQSMSRASFGSDALFLSSKGLTETLVEINKELGTSVQFSTDQLATFTKLRETAGLTNEELMGIQKLSLANGQSFDTNADSLLNQVSALNKASGIYINEKQVLKDISNLTAATTLSLGKNPEALGEAVQVARSLGMEMAKVESIADSLLDFESSISNELQAELLLGRDINLEKARQAALNNDLATLAQEIADQAGTAAEFAQMNRIQQDAIAKSVGMGREELAQTLFVQEQLQGASEEEAERRQRLLDARIEEVGLAQAQRELEENGLENMLNQATAAEKMEASMGKINELFTAIGAMFAPVVDMFASVAGYIMESKVAMTIFAGLIGGVTTALGFLAIKAMMVAIPKIYGGIIGMLGPIGIPVAIAATVGMLASMASAVAATKANDLYSEGTGGSGYGKRTLLAPEGAFALNNKDTVIAGTNLFKGDDVISAGAGQVSVASSDNKVGERTNMLLEKMITQNSKKPEMSPVGLYEIS